MYDLFATIIFVFRFFILLCNSNQKRIMKKLLMLFAMVAFVGASFASVTTEGDDKDKKGAKKEACCKSKTAGAEAKACAGKDEAKACAGKEASTASAAEGKKACCKSKVASSCSGEKAKAEVEKETAL